jgi:hypothetical protein
MKVKEAMHKLETRRVLVWRKICLIAEDVRFWHLAYVS